jgi:hypothetical protein
MIHDLDIASALADTSYYISPTEYAALTPAITALTPAITALSLVARTENFSLYRSTGSQLTTLFAATR